MKKILYILCAMFALASCSKEELPNTGDQNSDGTHTFNLVVDEPNTRAVVTTNRYVMEMYEGNLTATPTKQTNSTGVFNVSMKKNIDYICLFWADNGATYNVESLKAVKQVDETAQGTAAYFANVTVNSKTLDGAITLKRAVAELSFIDTNGLTEASNTLKITYPYASATLNLSDGTVTYAAGSTVRTIADIAPPTAATDAFTTDYILAPTVAGKILGLKLKLNSKPESTIAETNIKANVKTKIRGDYHGKPAPINASVGDFYMKDGTVLPGTTTLSAEQQANCIGIVYWAGDPTINDAALKAAHPNCTNGLMLALKEEGPAVWQTTSSDVNAWIIANTSYAPIASAFNLIDPINKIMGYNNTKAIEAFNADAANSANKVVWVDKVVAYRTAVPTPDGNSGWFVPSMKELTLICGLASQDANVYHDSYGTDNRDAINTQLAKISGSTQITHENYCTSTEYGNFGAWNVYFAEGLSNTVAKNENMKFRFVSAF